jgi:4-hydroxy-4-methyl-2-oxoglutarate aldolase
MSRDRLARLTALDACAVSDALDWACLPGSVPGLRPLSGTRLAGRARTALTGSPRSPPTSPSTSPGPGCSTATW